MGNLQLRVGILILLIGWGYMGYERVFNKDSFYDTLLGKINSHWDDNPFHSFWFGEKEGTMEDVLAAYEIDVAIEYACPILLLLTGWRIFLIHPIMHVVMTGGWAFNAWGSRKDDFKFVMSIQMWIQLAAMLLYMTSICKKKAPLPADHPTADGKQKS